MPDFLNFFLKKKPKFSKTFSVFENGNTLKLNNTGDQPEHFYRLGQPWATSRLITADAAAAKSLQSCLTLCDAIDSSPTRLPCPWDSLGKNTGAGCHFLLQCMKVKSESEVAQSCLTLSDPMDCSLPGSSIHGIFQARVLE